MIEQMIAQRLQSTVLVFLAHQERNVVIATTERNHTYWDIAHSIESLCFETYIFPTQVAYHTDDTHVVVYGYDAVLLEVVQDFVQVLGIVDRYRYTDL